MPRTIAVAGKGGTGKTVIAALLVKLLSERGLVLAVDADPSTNLNLALGLPLKDSETIGYVREKLTRDIAKGQLSPSIAKQDYLFGKIRESLVESKGFDLLAMGRPEGPGCYCASNEFLRVSLDQLVKDYKYSYVVMDCEAGMEHISRQTTRDIDMLLVIANPTMKSIIVAAKIKELIGEMRAAIGRIALVVNRVNGELPPEIKQAIADAGLELVATIPEDPYIAGLEVKGTPVTALPQDSPLRLKVEEIASRVIA